jgi:hypothetical protein
MHSNRLVVGSSSSLEMFESPGMDDIILDVVVDESLDIVGDSAAVDGMEKAEEGKLWLHKRARRKPRQWEK